MSLFEMLVCAGACFIAVLAALGSVFIWRLIAGRMERMVHFDLCNGVTTPRDTIVRGGVITLILRNNGLEPCRLYIRSPEVELVSPFIPTGRTKEWSVYLTPKTYHLSLSVAGQGRQTQQSLLRVVPDLSQGEPM